MREEDRITLRQNLVQSMHEAGVGEADSGEGLMTELLEKLELELFLDLPLIALSNGQTRRARILRALLRRPKVLLLDEPLSKCSLTKLECLYSDNVTAGLDVHHRPKLLSLLHALHKTSSPHIIMSLRIQDAVPDWITHVVLVRPGGEIVTASKQELQPELDQHYERHFAAEKETASASHHASSSQQIAKPAVIDLQNVNVKYHERHVSAFGVS